MCIEMYKMHTKMYDFLICSYVVKTQYFLLFSSPYGLIWPHVDGVPIIGQVVYLGEPDWLEGTTWYTKMYDGLSEGVA